MHVSETLRKAIKDILDGAGILDVDFSIEHPGDLSFGDYSTNAALVAAKKAKRNPRDIAEMLIRALKEKKIESVDRIEVAGPGFINIFLSDDFFRKSIAEILDGKSQFGKGVSFIGKKIMVEHTDPNPFKEFHIGHLMTNTIGTCIAGLLRWQGAEVKEANYQGDVGLHVASAVWAMSRGKGNMPPQNETLSAKIKYLAESYVSGRRACDRTDFWSVLFGGPTKYDIQKEVAEINKKIYDRSDASINSLYDTGRKWSLEYFETIYERLGTKFGFYFFESEAAPVGIELVNKNIGKVFEKSDGAVVFSGEKHGLHTRVFINKDGLPTYEAKELALAQIKYKKYPYDTSIVVTANEVSEYFKVLLKALSFIDKSLAEKTFHVGHGVLRLPSGKMSSRTGEVITALSLLSEISDVVRAKMKNSSLPTLEKEKIVDDIAMGAFRFSVLRQTLGRDIVFDFDKSLSFEGDSGPYLQYTVVRAKSVIEKARAANKNPGRASLKWETTLIERALYHFPEIIERAANNRAPQLLVSYLLELAGIFNTYYSKTKIIDDSPDSPYRLSLTEAVSVVISNGLSILGIRIPERM